jgi:hypothetical protein
LRLSERHHSGRDPTIRLVHVVWREEQAAEMVTRLNALTSDGDGGYAWREAWVSRRDPDALPVITAKDRKLLEFAWMHGALDTERPISVFFSFFFNLPGALAACEELRTLGWPEASADEEVTGDDLWHVYTSGRRQRVSDAAITRLRVEMEDLAERHQGTFDGWNVTGRGLGWAEPGQLPE